MKSVGEILPSVKKDLPAGKAEKNRKTERGELMRFFLRHLNYSRAHDGLIPITMARLGHILEGIPTKDLYYLQSVCSRAKSFSKKFWWEIDPKKHLQNLV